ncbi:MAG TPA: U32 family peptidase [Deltaproteobacteria bacterium]|nr:U32 family peptidase [Deltaproteobacteria bacterium]
MTQIDKKIELLAPVGNFEKLEIAVHYGADAVYLGGKEFSLRNFSGNFTLAELEKALGFAHTHGVKVYLTCNVFLRNSEQTAVADYLQSVGDLGIDAVIISDPGIIATARKRIPNIPIHLSTQANTTNLNSALFWQNFGVKRINAARELSLDEIREIAEAGEIEVEAFVHGAMCVAYSGRCLLSGFMTGRESNRGMCTHPCRWNYAVVEETRPGEYYPITEDDRGSYIFNSRDLCMINHIPELITSGIFSLKIEGRMKGINYVASAVKVYREAIDTFYEKPEGYSVEDYWIHELSNISSRGLSTGFYFGDPDQILPNFENQMQQSQYRLAGKVLEAGDSSLTRVEVRNKVFKGDRVNIIGASGPPRPDVIKEIIDGTGRSVPYAQPGSMVHMVFDTDCSPLDLIRRIETDPQDS